MMRSLRAWAHEVAHQGMNMPIQLTLLLLAAYGGEEIWVKTALSTLAILGITSRAVRHDSKFWFAVTAVYVFGNSRIWYQLDNHKYLIGYWCFALFCCLQSRRSNEALALNARLLIGIGFALAVLWKIASPDYLDSSFFRYALLTDPRFRDLSRAITHMGNAAASFNMTAIEALQSHDSRMEVVQLQSNEGVGRLAILMTWWTIGIEGVVATAFLLPRFAWLHTKRNIFLLSFLVSTYAIAPVIGFGWILGVMGLSQTKPDAWRMRAAYLCAILLLQLYRIPWKQMI